MTKREKAPDNRLVGDDSGVPHGAIDHGLFAFVDPAIAAASLARGVDVTAATVTKEPEWTHGKMDENYAVIDAQGNPHWATEGEIEEIGRDWARRGMAYNRMRDAQALDARALLDGRLPEDWKSGDFVPDCAKANHPDSHYQSDWASHRLCTCPVEYFMMSVREYEQQQAQSFQFQKAS